MEEFLLLPQKHAQISTDIISRILANAYILFLKTQNFHWNVKAIHFKPMHMLFEEQYKQLLEICDNLAERIATLGFRSPGSFQEFSKLTFIEENTKNLADIEMLKILRKDYIQIIQYIRTNLDHIDNCRDEASMSLLGEILLKLEKNFWILNSHLTELQG